MKKSWIIILIIGVIIIGIITGIAISQKNNKENSEKNIITNEINEVSEMVSDECTEEWKEMQEQAKEDLEANSSEEKISPNCLLILKRYYSECEHTINEYIDIPEKLVNKTQKDIEEEYPNWEVKKYSSTQIILFKEFESNCGQHYILKNDNGKIVIYIINENNEETIYENTDISIEYLTETDKQEIEKGIKVNGKENLYQLIEDFE